MFKTPYVTIGSWIYMWGVIILICVITSLLTGCNAKNIKVVETLSVSESDGPTFPWDFPSACGLSSVTCDNGDLEVNLERALANHITCRYEAPEPVCNPEQHDCGVVSYCGDESAAVIKAGVAANRYLLSLKPEEQAQEGSLAQYLAWALGGNPQGFPMSEGDLSIFGYISSPQ